MSPLVHSRTGAGAQAAVATITLDSPHNRNALSTQLLSELLAAVQATLRDPDVRVIVLTHTGSAFCSGADLRQADSGDRAGALPATMPVVLEALWNATKPVVARVAGPVRAGGIGLLGACDLVVCTEEATFAFTEVRLGLVPAVISSALLPRLFRPAAHELFLTGETFDGRRAVHIGLASAAVPAADLDSHVQRYVDALLRGAPGALAATKRLLRQEPPPGIGDLAELAQLSAQHFAGDEGREGIAAFVGKRNPAWVPAAE